MLCEVLSIGSIAIDTTVEYAIYVLTGVVFLAVVLPLVMTQQGTSACVGPFKAVGSVLADMTGSNICG